MTDKSKYNMPIDQLNFEEVSRHTFHFKALILCFERLGNFGLYSMALYGLSFLNIDYHMYNHSICYIYYPSCSGQPALHKVSGYVSGCFGIMGLWNPLPIDDFVRCLQIFHQNIVGFQGLLFTCSGVIFVVENNSSGLSY